MQFPMNLRISLSISAKKKSFGILIWIATESVEFLGYIDLMTILGLPAQEHGVSFIEVFFRISFSNLF